jgi:hypothetical protein
MTCSYMALQETTKMWTCSWGTSMGATTPSSASAPRRSPPTLERRPLNHWRPAPPRFPPGQPWPPLRRRFPSLNHRLPISPPLIPPIILVLRQPPPRLHRSRYRRLLRIVHCPHDRSHQIHHWPLPLPLPHWEWGPVRPPHRPHRHRHRALRTTGFLL